MAKFESRGESGKSDFDLAGNDSTAPVLAEYRVFF